MRHELSLPMACLLSLAAVATACAGDRMGSQRSAQDQQSQQEKGREIVSETQRSGQQGHQREGHESSAAQKQDQERLNQQMRSEGNAMGVPEPGTTSDQESTTKQRNPGRQHSMRENAQVSVGGSKPFVYGTVLRIEGDEYFVKDLESGDEVRLIVNRDTNLDCGAAPTSGGSMSTDRQQSDQSNTSGRQRMQGQRPDETAAGSGFKAGDCSFNTGDHVKAEVSDVGTVTTLKFIPEDQIQGHVRPSSSTGPMGSGTQSEGVSADDTRDKSPSRGALQERIQGQEAPQGLRQQH